MTNENDDYLASIIVKDLYQSSLHSVPVNHDWSGEGFGESWDFTQAVRCENCEKVLTGSSYIHCEQSEDEVYCKHCDGLITFDSDEWHHEDSVDDEHVAEPDDDTKPGCGHETLAEGPMMNYWYPVHFSAPGEVAKLLIDLPLCAVEVDGETGLALTGGGMDLTWEICEAFILIGQLPPLHFAQGLPKMATTYDEGKRKIVEACRESINRSIESATYSLKRLDDTAEWMEQFTTNDTKDQ